MAGSSSKGSPYQVLNPEDSLTKDGSRINVAGHVWYSKDDLISLDTKELNFAKKESRT